MALRLIVNTWLFGVGVTGEFAGIHHLHDRDSTLPGDLLQIPVPAALGLIPPPGDWPAGELADRSPFLDLDIDGLHEALFDTRGEPGFEQLSSALRQPAPPAEPDFAAPQPAADAAAVLAGVVAVEQGLAVDALFAPLFLQEFDPVERAGPPRRPPRRSPA